MTSPFPGTVRFRLGGTGSVLIVAPTFMRGDAYL